MKKSSPSIRSRLLLGFGALFALLLLCCAVGIFGMARSNALFESYLTGLKAREDQIKSIRNAVDRRAIVNRNLLLARDPAAAQQYAAQFDEANAQVSEKLQALSRAVAGGDVASKVRDQAVDGNGRAPAERLPRKLLGPGCVVHGAGDAA